MEPFAEVTDAVVRLVHGHVVRGSRPRLAHDALAGLVGDRAGPFTCEFERGKRGRASSRHAPQPVFGRLSKTAFLFRLPLFGGVLLCV